MGESTVEDDHRDILCLLHKVVNVDVELAGGCVLSALDVSAGPVVVTDVDDAVVLARDFVALDDRS